MTAMRGPRIGWRPTCSRRFPQPPVVGERNGPETATVRCRASSGRRDGAGPAGQAAVSATPGRPVRAILLACHWGGSRHRALFAVLGIVQHRGGSVDDRLHHHFWNTVSVSTACLSSVAVLRRWQPLSRQA